MFQDLGDETSKQRVAAEWLTGVGKHMGVQRKSAIPRDTEACRTSQTLLSHKGIGLWRGSGEQGRLPRGSNAGSLRRQVWRRPAAVRIPTWKRRREVGGDTGQT